MWKSSPQEKQRMSLQSSLNVGGNLSEVFREHCENVLALSHSTLAIHQCLKATVAIVLWCDTGSSAFFDLYVQKGNIVKGQGQFYHYKEKRCCWDDHRVQSGTI